MFALQCTSDVTAIASDAIFAKAVAAAAAVATAFSLLRRRWISILNLI